MEKYLQHLLADIEQVILERWRMSPPHFYSAGQRYSYLIPPEGWEEEPKENQTVLNEFKQERALEKSLEEAEAYVAGVEEGAMIHQFGELKIEDFPPADRFTDEQLDRLNFAILRLWEAHNYSLIFPAKTPSPILYPLLVQRMTEPIMPINFGHIGIEFCHYEPEDCPFGYEYCDCKDCDWQDYIVNEEE